jgi:hypothetical protein
MALLYHRTTPEGARAIRASGFEASLYDAFDKGLTGVYLCSSSGLHQSLGDSLLMVEIPDEELDPEWSDPCLDDPRSTD